MCCARTMGRSRSPYKLYSSYIQLLSGTFPHIVRDHTPVPCRFSASSNESCLSSILLSRKAYCVRQLLVASSPRHIHNIANTSRYLSWPNLARGNDHSLGNPLACRVEAAAAAQNVHRRHLIRRKLRLRLVQPQKKLRILLFPMASIANL